MTINSAEHLAMHGLGYDRTGLADIVSLEGDRVGLVDVRGQIIEPIPPLCAGYRESLTLDGVEVPTLTAITDVMPTVLGLDDQDADLINIPLGVRPIFGTGLSWGEIYAVVIHDAGYGEIAGSGTAADMPLLASRSPLPGAQTPQWWDAVTAQHAVEPGSAWTWFPGAHDGVVLGDPPGVPTLGYASAMQRVAAWLRMARVQGADTIGYAVLSRWRLGDTMRSETLIETRRGSIVHRKQGGANAVRSTDAHVGYGVAARRDLAHVACHPLAGFLAPIVALGRGQVGARSWQTDIADTSAPPASEPPHDRRYDGPAVVGELTRLTDGWKPPTPDQVAPLTGLFG